MDPSYEVPEKERVNAEKKRQQMILLENSIFNLRVDFNKKLENLKSRKQEIVETVTEKNKLIAEKNKELGIEEELFTPEIDVALEYPDKIYEIDTPELVSYAYRKAQDMADANKPKKSQFGSKKPNPNDKLVKSKDLLAAEAFDKRYQEELAKSNQKEQVAEPPVAKDRKGARPGDIELSPVDEKFAVIRRIEITYEKEQL